MSLNDMILSFKTKCYALKINAFQFNISYIYENNNKILA